MGGLIVHEWLEPNGGAEKVVEQLAEIFPQEHILALWDDAPGRFSEGRVIESWLSRTKLRSHKALALPFMLQAWRSLDYAKIDWVLCSSHLFAHHASFRHPNKDVRKLVYAYTPARYVWNAELDRRGDNRMIRMASKPLQIIDRHRAQEATSVVAISRFVRERIQQHWNRSCDVIYPPVDVEYFKQSRLGELTPDEVKVIDALPQPYVFGASRFIPYKRLDEVIRFGETARLPVVLAGSGPEEASLREIAAEATVPVLFISSPSLPMLRELYSAALAFVFPAIEDFGIMPVEAMATGTPVIAGRVGGTAETVIDGKSGSLIDFRSVSETLAAVEFAQRDSAQDCVEEAERFDSSVFRLRIQEWVGS